MLHFRQEEFACHCGCGNSCIDLELIQSLEKLRSYMGDKPIKIISGRRCPSHNREVGGAKRSQHLQGKAADISVQDYSPKQVLAACEALFPGKYGLGLYKHWVHLDIRTPKARW